MLFGRAQTMWKAESKAAERFTFWFGTALDSSVGGLSARRGRPDIVDRVFRAVVKVVDR